MHELRSLGVNRLAKETGVSLARFARLITLVRDGLPPGIRSHFRPADSRDSGSLCSMSTSSSALLPSGFCTLSVMLSFLWATARSKADVLEFYEAAASHLPPGKLLESGGAYKPQCERWRQEWVQSSFDRASIEDGSPGTAAAAAHLAAIGALPERSDVSVHAGHALEAVAEAVDDERTSSALELLAFALASRGSDRPEIEQARHGFKGQTAVPDCVEAVARDAISLALWDFDAMRFDPARLPERAEPRVRNFFGSTKGYSSGYASGAEWFDICSARSGLRYVSGQSLLHVSGIDGSAVAMSGRYGGNDGCSTAYELHPSLQSFHAAMESLLGVELNAPSEDDGSLTPLWPAAKVGWHVRALGTDRPVLRLRPFVAKGGASCAHRGVSSRRSEELVIVFKDRVHCYALRRVVSDEPQWIRGVGCAWLQRWRELGAGGFANGPLPCATHELAASALLGRLLLVASAHGLEKQQHQQDQRRRQGHPESIFTCPASAAAESALLAVLSAAPFGFEERTSALRLCLHAGPSVWWVLPLLLQPPAATNQWDRLTLGACAELLEPALREQARSDGGTAHGYVELCAAAAADQPALQAVLALRTSEHQDATLRSALARCSQNERAEVLHIAVGFGGYSLKQRMRACAAVCEAWWTEWRARGGAGDVARRKRRMEHEARYRTTT